MQVTKNTEINMKNLTRDINIRNRLECKTYRKKAAQ